MPHSKFHLESRNESLKDNVYEAQHGPVESYKEEQKFRLVHLHQ